MTDLPPTVLVILVLLALDHTDNHGPGLGRLRQSVEMPFAIITTPIATSVEVSGRRQLEIHMAGSGLFLLYREPEVHLVHFHLLA